MPTAVSKYSSGGANWEAKAWNWPLEGGNDGLVKVQNDRTKFHVALDVPSYTKDQITVDIANDEVLISCDDDNRAVHRAYHLPKDVDPKTLTHALSPRGHLHIEAKKKSKW